MTQPTIKSPYAAHTTVAKDRRFLAENDWYDPDFILAKVAHPKRAGWWELDDLLRSVLGYDQFTRLNKGYYVILKPDMNKLVEGFGENADRLEFRLLPPKP